MKQSLQLKLGQQLTMTPQLQQAIRLLQLSTLDLQQEIQEALDSNPMLEVEEPGDSSGADGADGEDSDYRRELEIPATIGDSLSAEAARDGDMDGYGEVEAAGDWNEAIPSDLPVDTSWDDVYQSPQSNTPAYDGEDSDYDSRRGTTDSLYDHVMWQLNLTPMSDADRIIAMAIIDAVEPSGMLSLSLEEIHAGLCEDWEEEWGELEYDEMVAVQHRLQQFDPCGVASQNLSECLLVQLQQFPADTPYIDAARLIVHFSDILGTGMLPSYQQGHVVLPALWKQVA
jgi:RNA polymerase sigma-54 factor